MNGVKADELNNRTITDAIYLSCIIFNFSNLDLIIFRIVTYFEMQFYPSSNASQECALACKLTPALIIFFIRPAIKPSCNITNKEELLLKQLKLSTESIFSIRIDDSS